MLTIAPLDYERYLALVGPFPLAEAVAKSVPAQRHTEELTQISKRMDLWHEFSAEGERQRARRARQTGQRNAPPVTPVHAAPQTEVAWSMVIEAASAIGSGGATLKTPPLKIALSLYHPVIDAPPPTIRETA